MNRYVQTISTTPASRAAQLDDQFGASRGGAFRRGRLFFFSFGLLALAGCGAGATPAPQSPPPPTIVEPTPPPPSSPPPAVSDPKAEDTLPFVASGSGPTEGQAYNQARQRLLVALMDEESLLKPDRFTTDLGQAVHLQDSDFFEAKSEKDGFVVKIGLSQEALEAAFVRLQAALGETKVEGVPEQLAEPIEAFRRARYLRSLCLRQKKLSLETECEPTDLGPPKQKLQKLLRTIVIASRYEGGIPSTDEAFLRPLALEVALFAGRKKESLATLPLLLSWPEQDEPVFLTTDQNGTVSFALPEDLSTKTKFTVALNEEALLGPEPEQLAAQTSLSLGARPVGLARTAWVLERTDTASKLAKKAAQQKLRQLLNQPISLDGKDSMLIQGKSGHGLSRALRKLADEKRGELDTVLVLDAQSEFASRMGTHRVWYEARGKLTAFNAWTGEVLAEVSALVTESGVGESRAEKAAREALGEELADKLRRELDDRAKPTAQAAR